MYRDLAWQHSQREGQGASQVSIAFLPRRSGFVIRQASGHNATHHGISTASFVSIIRKAADFFSNAAPDGCGARQCW